MQSITPTLIIQMPKAQQPQPPPLFEPQLQKRIDIDGCAYDQESFEEVYGDSQKWYTSRPATVSMQGKIVPYPVGVVDVDDMMAASSPAVRKEIKPSANKCLVILFWLHLCGLVEIVTGPNLDKMGETNEDGVLRVYGKQNVLFYFHDFPILSILFKAHG